MGNLIQRNRGKRGAPDVTRNLSTGKVTTTYRDPRKKGSLGLRVTKSHLTETGYGYFEHLLRTWKVAGVLILHGLLPSIWKDKASNLLCENQHEKNGKT